MQVTGGIRQCFEIIHRILLLFHPFECFGDLRPKIGQLGAGHPLVETVGESVERRQCFGFHRHINGGFHRFIVRVALFWTGSAKATIFTTAITISHGIPLG